MVDSINIKELNYLNVIKGLSFCIEKNKIISLSGPNNCGKTSLLKILAKQIDSQEDITVLDKKIDEYKLTDYNKLVKAIIPNEICFIHNTVEEELNYYIDQLFLSKEEKNKRLKSIYKNLNLSKLKKTQIKDLASNEKLFLQISLVIATMPKIILIDDLTNYLKSEEVIDIVNYLKYLIKNYDLTVLIVSTRLEDILQTDKLFILSDSKIILSGAPLEVLQKDNILNKSGIRVPFMIDLSVKLKDYNLINEVELDINRMIDKLWN